MVSPRVRLAKRIQSFLSREDRSLNHVNQMEGILIEHFSDTDLFEELSPCLAMYRPGGGDHLCNGEELAKELRNVLERYLSDDADR